MCLSQLSLKVSYKNQVVLSSFLHIHKHLRHKCLIIVDTYNCLFWFNRTVVYTYVEGDDFRISV